MLMHALALTSPFIRTKEPSLTSPRPFIAPPANFFVGTIRSSKQCSLGIHQTQINQSDCQVLEVIHHTREHLSTMQESSGDTLYTTPANCTLVEIHFNKQKHLPIILVIKKGVRILLAI